MEVLVRKRRSDIAVHVSCKDINFLVFPAINGRNIFLRQSCHHLRNRHVRKPRLADVRLIAYYADGHAIMPLTVAFYRLAPFRRQLLSSFNLQPRAFLSQLRSFSCATLRSDGCCLFPDGGIVGKGFGLAVACLYPLVEVLDVGFRDTEAGVCIGPRLIIVGEVGGHGLVLIVEAKHHLMLIKRAVPVCLVNDKDLAAIPLVHVGVQEHVYMVTVNTLGPLDVTVGIGHCVAPLLAVSVNTFAQTASSVFYGNVKLTDSYMAFLVITGRGLCRGRFCVHLCGCGLDCGLNCLLALAISRLRRTFFTTFLFI